METLIPTKPSWANSWTGALTAQAPHHTGDTSPLFLPTPSPHLPARRPPATVTRALLVSSSALERVLQLTNPDTLAKAQRVAAWDGLCFEAMPLVDATLAFPGKKYYSR